MDPAQNPHGTPDGTLRGLSGSHAAPDNGFVLYKQQSDSPTGTPSLNSFSDPAPPENHGPALVPQCPEPQKPVEVQSRVTLWLHRSSLVISVIFCIELGMVLAILPWTRVWTENSFLLGYPALKTFLQNNFVRGMITGIGLLDIWLGIAEAVYYRETPERQG